MAVPEHNSPLPRVEETDLLNLMFEEIVDPSHSRRWRDLATSNPILARELLRYAHHSIRELQAPHSRECEALIISAVTFALCALEHAAIREAAPAELEITSVGDDGEVLPPSVSPHDD